MPPEATGPYDSVSNPVSPPCELRAVSKSSEMRTSPGFASGASFQRTTWHVPAGTGISTDERCSSRASIDAPESFMPAVESSAARRRSSTSRAWLRAATTGSLPHDAHGLDADAGGAAIASEAAGAGATFGGAAGGGRCAHASGTASARRRPDARAPMVPYGFVRGLGLPPSVGAAWLKCSGSGSGAGTMTGTDVGTIAGSGGLRASSHGRSRK